MWCSSVSVGDTSKLRRFRFESATSIVAHLRQQVTSESANAPRKLPQAGKTARYDDQKNRQRRVLAFDMNNIITWGTHEKWTSCFLHALTREVPPGYSSIRISQLLRADSGLFLLMSVRQG